MKLFVLYALLLLTVFGSGAGLWYEHGEVASLRATVETQSEQLSSFESRQKRFEAGANRNTETFNQDLKLVFKAFSEVFKELHQTSTEDQDPTKDKL